MGLFGKLFNTQKKDFTYSGPRPPGSLLSVTGGKPYYDTLQARLAGRGVGFGEGYADKYANPIIQNLRSRFESYTMPELESELSRTGRRRGTSGFQQISQARREQGLSEGDVFSRLQQRNENQQRQEINDALSRTGQFAENEADLQNRAANFEYSNIYAPQVKREQDRMTNEAAGYQNLTNAAADLAGNYLIPRASSVMSRLRQRTPSFSTPPSGYQYGFNPFGKVNKSVQYGQAGGVR